MLRLDTAFDFALYLQGVLLKQSKLVGHLCLFGSEAFQLRAELLILGRHRGKLMFEFLQPAIEFVLFVLNASSFLDLAVLVVVQ